MTDRTREEIEELLLESPHDPDLMAEWERVCEGKMTETKENA